MERFRPQEGEIKIEIVGDSGEDSGNEADSDSTEDNVA